jgi:signal transduction histidine kinase
MPSLDRDWARPGPTRVQVRRDVYMAVLVAVVSVVSTEVWHSAYGSPLGWRGVEAFLWFGLAGLALAGRRRFPLSTLVVESAVFIVIGERLQALAGVFTIQMILFASIYAAWAWSRHAKALVAVSAVVLVAMFGWLSWAFMQPGRFPRNADVGMIDAFTALVIYAVAINIVYFLGAIAWGHAAWRSARRRAQIEEQAERERAQQAVERERAVQAERVRIARDLHDVVAHHVSGIGVQAAGAGRVLEVEPESAREALTTIERSSRHAVAQMHQLVGLLRTTDDVQVEDRGPKPGLADIAALASADAVPVVEHRVVGEPFPVSDTVALSLYRVAQEAVSNVRRHAAARRAAVVVRYVDPAADGLRAAEVEVTDDGRGPDSNGSGGGGFGLTGIRERAAMHGGDVEIGPRPQGGFRVRVRIPVGSA